MFRAFAGLPFGFVGARPACAGVTFVGVALLRQRDDLALDLRHPRFSPTDTAAQLVETAAAESFAPRADVAKDGLQAVESVLLRADRFSNLLQGRLNPALQLPRGGTVVGRVLVDGQDEPVVGPTPGDVAGNRHHDRPLQRRRGLQDFAGALQGIPIGYRNPHETGWIVLGESAHLLGRPENPRQVDGVGLDVLDPGLVQPAGNLPDVPVDGRETGAFQRLSVRLRNFPAAFAVAQRNGAFALGSRQHAVNEIRVRVDLAFAGQLEDGRVKGKDPACRLSLLNLFPRRLDLDLEAGTLRVQRAL